MIYGWADCLAIFRREHVMNNRKQTILLILVFLVSLGGTIFAVSHLREANRQYQKGEDTYQNLQDEYTDEPDNGLEKQEKEQDGEEPHLLIDFERLQAMNPDVIGWIDIPGAGISYPLLQGEDNSYYLTHMGNGEYGIHGSIFMDVHNTPDLSDNNTIIYGHNMKDGTMFAALDAYQNPELYQRYPYFYIHLPGYIVEYQIFSCYSARTGSSAYTYAFGQEEAFRDFLSSIKSYAGYETGVGVETTDHIVTLSTCVNTDRNYRYVVHGKEVRKMEEKEHD